MTADSNSLAGQGATAGREVAPARGAVRARPKPLILAVPFYKAEHLVAPLLRSISLCEEELGELKTEVILLNDSPDYQPLATALEESVSQAGPSAARMRVLKNDRNLGFVGTINRVFRMALEEEKDIVILNSDTVLFPGALREMLEVARSDRMIGFVCPRSNNATICSLPRQRELQNSLPAQASAYHAEIAQYLPRKTYIPTAIGFCMLVKWEVLAEFGEFDTIYGGGYNEENDLVCRAGMVGYRAVMANRAFVWHEGEQSFSLSEVPKSEREEKNRQILLSRYPHYMSLVQAYENSAYQQAEYLMGGLLTGEDGRREIAFDFSHFGLHHNGTYEAAKALLAEACRTWADDYEISVVVDESAWRFHELDKLPNLKRYDVDSPRCYAAIVRIGQPFDWESVERLAYKSPVVAVSMLDTIALDCGSLYDPQVHRIWQFVAETADVFLTISQYTMDQFESRFAIAPEAVKKASLLSVDVADYAKASTVGKVDPALEGAILVIGNHFPHKHVAATLDELLEALPDARFITLGVPTDNERVTNFAAGELTDEEIATIYRSCSIIVFPSHYEGFGLPIMHALANQKPLFLRRMPVYDEILDAMGGSRNVYSFGTTSELSAMLSKGLPNWIPEAVSSGNGWERATKDLREAVEAGIERVSFDRVVHRLRSLESRRPTIVVQNAGGASPAAATGAGTPDFRTRAAERVGVLARRLATVAFRVPGVLFIIRGVNRVARPVYRAIAR